MLESADPRAHELLARETSFRSRILDLVPSDNHPSQAVQETSAYPLFYSENDGRNYYYPACETVAEVEALAVERALDAFPGAEHVNVKPTDGTRANQAAYSAVLRPGDRILSLGLAEGGHLSHGLKWNYSGQLYDIVHYSVTREGLLDYDEIRRLALEHKPQLMIAGGSSCPFAWDFESFASIAREAGALLHADISHFGGLVISGHHPTPFPHADLVMTTLQKTIGGTKGAIVFSREETAKDLNRSVFPGVMAHATGGHLLAKAVVLGETLKPEFKVLMERVVTNARALAAALAGCGHALVTGGTETHLMVVDLSAMGITGKEGERRLQDVGILANKQLIPADTQKPTVCSGVRLGTPCMSTRGMGEPEMERIAVLVNKALRGEDPEATRSEVEELGREFPVPGLPK